MSKYPIGTRVKRVKASTHEFRKRIGEIRKVVAHSDGGWGFYIILDTGFRREESYFNNNFKVIPRNTSIGGKAL